MSINGAAGAATVAGEAVLWFRMQRAHSNETRRTAAHARKARPHSRPPPRPAAARLGALRRGARRGGARERILQRAPRGSFLARSRGTHSIRSEERRVGKECRVEWQEQQDQNKE